MDLFIKTEMHRNFEFSRVMEFSATAYKELDDKNLTQIKVAEVSGAIFQRPLLGEIDEIPWDCFDARSAHAETAIFVIREEIDKIEELLELELEEISNFDSIVFLEEAKVDKEYRGHGIALRLMREVSFIFQNSFPLYILKAHPTGQSGEVTDDDCRKLGAYYMSDPVLGFKELDPKKYAGWLVSKGNAGIAETSDNYFFETSSGN